LTNELTQTHQALLNQWIEQVYQGKPFSIEDLSSITSFFDEISDDNDLYNSEWAGFKSLNEIALIGTRLDQCVASALEEGGYDKSRRGGSMEQAVEAFTACLLAEDSDFGYFSREISDSNGRTAVVVVETCYQRQSGHTDEVIMMTDTIRTAEIFLSNQGVLEVIATQKNCELSELFLKQEIEAMIHAGIERGYQYYAKKRFNSIIYTPK